MTRARSLLTDGGWIASMQVLAALGQLVGIRLLTDILPPSVFGEISLWLGGITLVVVGIANPTMQAMVRYYPEYRLRDRGYQVRSVARRQLRKLALFVFPAVATGAIAVLSYRWASMTVMAMAAALVIVDIARMQNFAILNAVRSHRTYGIWAVAEAWGRPLLAWLFVVQMGVSTPLILTAFLMVSLVSWAIMRQFVPHDKDLITSLANPPELVNRFWQYTLPLLPLGFFGWVSGMADRYIIGALLSPAEVGLYVATYGLASRPMLMLSSILETTIRPAYQHALVEGNSRLAQNYLRKWALLAFWGSSVAIMVAWIAHSWLANLLLGEGYRDVSYLMPWIVGGYTFLAFTHVTNRVCYANEATQRILLIGAVGAALAVIIGIVCIKQAGLWGAAFAVPFYYGAQFTVSYILARPWLRIVKQQTNQYI